MFTIGRKKQEIFRTIIRSIVVYMVYYLAFFKRSTKFIFHNNPVLKNITGTICKRVILIPNHNISSFLLYLSTLPKTTFFASTQITMCFTPRNMTFFKFCIRRARSAKKFLTYLTLHLFSSLFSIQRMVFSRIKPMVAGGAPLAIETHLTPTINAVFHRVNIPTTWIQINSNYLSF